MGVIMRKFLLATIAVLLAVPAFAADLPAIVTKGPPAYPYDSSGFYFGANVMAGVQQNSINGNPTFTGSLVNGNLTAAGGAIGGTVGWTKGTAGFWWAIEDSLDYQNITASATTGNASTASRWSNETVVKVHGFNPLQYLPNLGITFPTFPTTFPATPAGISVGAAQLYIGAGAKEWGVSGNFGGIGGTTWAVAPMIEAGSVAQIIDTTGKPSGAALDLGAEVVFADRGFTFMAGPGSPVFAGAVKSGNQYFAYAKVLW